MVISKITGLPIKKRSLLIAECEKLAGWICKHKAGYKCERCGSSDCVQWAHIISRTYKRIKFDLDNCICLCKKCHKYFTNRPVEWELWITEKIGIEKYQELQKRAIDYVNKKRIDYVQIHAYLVEWWNFYRKQEPNQDFWNSIQKQL